MGRHLCYLLCEQALGERGFLLGPLQGIIRAGLGRCRCKCLPAWGMPTQMNQEAMMRSLSAPSLDAGQAESRV